jgi:hypothetical protein
MFCCVALWEGAHGTHWLGDWVDLRASADAVIELRPSSLYLIAIPIEISPLFSVCMELYLHFLTNSLVYLSEVVCEDGIWKEVSQVGRAIAQAVSRWLPTAAARVKTRV